MRTTESRVRVRYKETDQMGIVHHANYVVWFEIGRTDLCREAGIAYSEIERRGYILVVTEIGCRYRSSFRYDDEVVIRTAVADAGSRTIRFEYELLSSEGDLRATGFSSHVWLDMETRKPTRAADDLLNVFAPFVRQRED